MKKFLEKIEILDNIQQWAERDSIIKESVSQHSFKVAAIANFLLQQIEISTHPQQEYDSFSRDVLSYAIMHDFDEAIFGRDVSHMVKYNPYNDEQIRRAINEYVEHTLETEFFGLMKVPSPTVKRFVKMCDWLALLTFITRNSNMGAKMFKHENIYCRTHTLDAIKDVEKLLKSEFNIKIDLISLIKIDEL